MFMENQHETNNPHMWNGPHDDHYITWTES